MERLRAGFNRARAVEGLVGLPAVGASQNDVRALAKVGARRLRWALAVPRCMVSSASRALETVGTSSLRACLGHMAELLTMVALAHGRNILSNWTE